ncbi:CYTH domain-containing protein [Promicromonospora umidemergens]|uniref:CYTH domain-containing protein n=1 Tax=Promicromonospora umidemergens TaxID=629679 RepID=A0ABP8YB48_9MICO|nr:CYTH domain-containing protein [Promicromonospora umidemergens]MCP2286725.1 CYTH domain-containing protein [Promicromonospora umidemergens]
MRATTTVPTQLRDLVGLSDSVELKAIVRGRDSRRTVQALGIDLDGAQHVEVYYLDTPGRDLQKAGTILRVRRNQGARADSVVKVRPAVPRDLSASMRRRKGFKVEVDVTPADFVCSASFKARPADAAVKRALVGSVPVSQVFTGRQRQFFAAYAPGGVALDDLIILGPVTVLKTTPKPTGRAKAQLMPAALIAQLWTYPTGHSALELSTRAAPADLAQALADWQIFLTRHQVRLRKRQRTKTETALDLLSACP